MIPQVRNRAEFDELLRTATNYERVPEFHAGRVRIDLGRMQQYVARLGHPERDPIVVHITGTKGKGSTAAMVARLLSFHGGPVGLHTSPHLQRMEERVAVDAQPIDERGLLTATRQILAAEFAGSDLGFPTYFEFMTLVAFLEFARVKARFAVHEVGLGARLDATNVVSPAATAITNVDLEHTAILGGTIGEIATEKGGILKPGVPLVTGVDAAAWRTIEPLAQQLGCRVRRLDREIVVSDFKSVATGSEFTVETDRGVYARLRPALIGAHQAQNAAIGIGLAEDALASVGETLTPDRVRGALLGFSVPARLEVVAGSPTMVIDGGHTPNSVAMALRETRRAFPGLGIVVLFGIASDKDWIECARALRDTVAVVTTRYPHPRAADPEALAGVITTAGGRSESCPDPRIALDRSRELAENKNLVLVVGSLYLAAWVKSQIPR